MYPGILHHQHLQACSRRLRCRRHWPPAIKAFVKHVDNPLDLEAIEILRSAKWWISVLEWMPLVHAGQLPNFVEGTHQQSGEPLIIRQMFGAVEVMGGVGWMITKKVMERFRQLLGECHVDW